MDKMKRSLSKLLSLALAFLMLFEASGNAFAYMVEGSKTASQSEEEITLTDGNGNVTTPDESWEETFPYGAFAFEKSGLAVKEGENGIIKVYRLGGTAGRATAYIKYQPSVTQDENGDAIYDFAISAADAVVSVEEPQPAAKYQPAGKEPDPQETDAAVTASEGEDGWMLSVDVENAESYSWQVSENGGVWNDLDGADSASLPADAEALDERFDYRCVYTADGVRYCTDSLRGTEYVRAAEEELEAMPEDIDLNAEPVYTPLALDAEGEDPYSAWLFELVFADGEWVKELHIDALTDELAEAAEAATFTIVGCDGGEVLDSASTLLLRIEDTNDPEPSTLGFTAELVEADKAEGYATVMLRRVGGTSRPVTVKYATADDTAVAGTDYAYTEGTLLFYGGIDELPVRVELIDDGEASEDALRFYIELSELQGDDGCELDISRAAVELTNSGTGTGENTASRLYDPDAVDLSGSVNESASAASSADSGETVVSGEAQEIAEYEPVYSELRFEDPDAMTTQVYAGSVATIMFKNPSANVWTDTVDLASDKSWWGFVESSNHTNFYGKGETTGKLGSGGKYTLPSGIALTSRNDATVKFNGWGNAAIGAGADGEYAAQMFSQFQTAVRVDTAHDTAHLTGFHYDYSFTKPNLQIFQNGTILKTPQDSKRFGSGPLDKNWHIRSSDDWSNYSNPFTSNHTGAFSLSNFGTSIYLYMRYNSYSDHEHDELNDNTMIAVNNLTLTRRTFTDSAFKVEITTPNDENTAPDGGAVLSNYTNFVPSVAVENGGVQGSNTLYVGTKLRITAGTNTPNGYYLSDVVVYQSKDGGASWTKFDKFVKENNKTNDGVTIKLVGGSASAGGSSLTADDLTAQYKFRVVYARTSTVVVDLSPSLPRDSQNVGDVSKVSDVLNGYGTASDHGFIKNAEPTITYGSSTFDVEDYDNTTLRTDTLSKSKLTTSGSTLSFSAVNIQWVEFGLSSKDLLLVNGRAYPGNARIYLRESDLSGKMVVYYYHENYQNALNAMKTTITSIGVYWDGNNNGYIDGYYDEKAGQFILDQTSGDEFYGYIDEGEYNETLFAPKWSDKARDYCQYFLKVSYSMVPRCLSVPEGASDKERAQVMPAFITALNADSPAYSKSTIEQRQYRYLISGKTRYAENGAYDYSADNHPMYMAEASKVSTVDIPLGGDTAPAQLNAAETAYEWTPAFEGALLYKYAAPTPITIENSVAGVTEVTSGYKFENGELGYETEADRDKVNAYLGSFTGSTTFALVTQEQGRVLGEATEATQLTTDVIRTNVTPGAYGDYYVKPDSVTLGGVSTTPDASYLKEVKNPADSGSKQDINMDDSGSSMSEFNVDLGIDLGGTEIALTDAVTIIMDGNQVGFAIGVPLGEVDKDDGKKGIGDANKESWTQFKDFFDSSNFGGDDDYRKASDSYKSAKSGGYKPDGSDFRSKSMGVEFSMSIAFMFEYNPLDNGFYFEGMTISCSAEFSIRVQARLTVCPIVYFYMEFTAGIEATTGLGVIREAVEEKTAVLDAKGSDDEGKRIKLSYIHAPGTSTAIINEAAFEALTDKSDYQRVNGSDTYFWNAKRFKTEAEAKAEFLDSRDYLLTQLQRGLLSKTEQEAYKVDEASGYYYNNENYDTYAEAKAALDAATGWTFTTDRKAFNLRFKGKVSVEVLNADGTAAGGDYITGFLTSDGQSDTQVVLRKQDGMELGETVTVRLRPMEYDEAVVGDESTISYVARIENIRNEVYWKGIEITPSLGLEIGAGVGMELLKLELYAKVGLEATFLLGVYNEDYDGTNAKYKPASVESFEFAIGLGVRVVLLVFTFELDVATYVVEYEKGEGWETGWHFLNDWVGQSSEPGYLGVTITPPTAYSTQKLYTPEDNAEAEMSTQAYDPAYPDKVPFQLSGYNSNVNAYPLGEGMLSGTDYKLVSAGGRDFLFYTVSREGAASEDLPMLVMSEVTHNGSAYGFANPVDNGNTKQLYIPVEDDYTGDLDFDVWTKDNTVHVAWVNYAEPTTDVQTEPTAPGETPYGGMGADTYTKEEFEPKAPTTPYEKDGVKISKTNYKDLAPEEPKLAEVDASLYYTTETLTKEQFEALDEDKQVGYIYDEESENYWKEAPVGDYTDLDTAKEAYAAALAQAKAELETAKTKYAEDLVTYNEWVTYYEKLAEYTLWYNYYAALSDYNAWAQQRLANAAKKTEVKTAEWSFTAKQETKTVEVEGVKTEVDVTVYDSDEAFKNIKTVAGDDTTNYLFAPAMTGTGALFFGSAYTLDTNDAELKAYETYLKATQDNERVRNYLLRTKESTLDVFGKQSALNVAFQNGNDWTVSTMPLADKDGSTYTINNIAVQKLSDGNYYVAYTTSVDCYETYTKDGKELPDHFTEERLYLRRVTLTADAESGTTVDWGESYVLRVIRSYDAQTDKDGRYNTSGERTGAFESPYFSNLSFLNGKIDETKLTGEAYPTVYDAGGTPARDFLLFEMNGTTYVILDTDLKNITTTGSGTIYPFFTGSTVESTNKDGSTTEVAQVSGKLNVTIGADADGNLFAVYTSAVPNTTNNAIYIASYDPKAGWSDGVILAMDSMEVYEQSTKYNWSDKLTQAAYWGLQSNTKRPGLLSESDLENLFGETDGPAIESVLTGFDSTTKLGGARSVTLGSLQATAGADGRLLILTQATATRLAVAQDTSGNYTVAPAYRADNTIDTSSGVYAISYGKGEKDLGEGSIALDRSDFSAGTALYIEASAVNVGDTAFYGSASQPITVTLTVNGSGQELLKSTITQNVLPGQTIAIAKTAEALAENLKNGDKLVLTVSEYSDDSYHGESRNITLFTVEEKPDLGVEELSLTNPKVSADGSTTTYDFSFNAANRGSGDAGYVYVQISYADGEDKNGNRTYSALDLSLDGTKLTTNEEVQLAGYSTQAADDPNNAKNGIYYLRDEDGGTTIRAGYGRRVHGTLTVPSKAYAAGEAKGLELRVEIFSGNDSINTTLITQSAHNEYYTANNTASTASSAVTQFTAAARIVIPLGTTTLIPLSAVSSRGTKPSITVEETHDANDADGQNIGILNFKQSSASGGKVSGVVSITPSSLGTGIINVYDTATNSLVAIAFEVTDSKDGIDIYNDNESFEFYNKNGSKVDPADTAANGDWTFQSAATWGVKNTEEPEKSTEEAPLRNNLSYGKSGAYFRFSSVAESIDLYFSGTITVSTTHPNVADKTYTGLGGNQSVEIELGENKNLDAQTVTVRVTGAETAAFDRLVEHYPGNVVPLPSFDRVAPNLYWSRSFPATASIASGSGTKIALKLYGLDDGGVSYIEINGARYTAGDASVAQLDPDGRLLCYTFDDITANGTYNVAVADTSGNITRETLVVDWFIGENASGDPGTVTAPELTAGFYVGDDELAPTGHVGSKQLLDLKLNVTPETAEVRFLGEDGFEDPTEGSCPIGKNGIYWVRATGKTAKGNGVYSSVFLCMSQIDTEIPTASLAQSAEGLSWTAAKAGLSASVINEVTINGKKVNTTTGLKLSGTFPTTYSGSYEIVAADTVGNTSVTQPFTLTLPVSIANIRELTVYGAWNADKNNGKVVLDLTGVTGGTWDSTLSKTAEGTYRAQYQVALVSADTALDAITEDAWTPLTEGGTMTHTFENLALGSYKLVVRDAGKTDTSRYAVKDIEVTWEAIEAELAAALASYASAEDGVIGVTVTNGRADYYEFAVLPAPADWDGKDVSIAYFLSAATEENPLVWLPADNVSVSAYVRTLDSLAPANYLVAVRGLYGATEEDIAALKSLGRDLADAQNALKLATAPDAEQREKLEKAVEDAQAAYDAKAKELTAKSEALYGKDTTAEYWQRALVQSISLGFYDTSSVKSAGTNENGSSIIELKPGKKLTSTDSSKIYKENRENSVLLRRGSENVYLPAGTLTPGFDVNRILIDSSAAADGMVVQYTDTDGNVSILPFCIVSADRVSYFVLGPGDYELVPASCEFTDIAGLWGEDAIRFAAHRGLLSGVGNDLFAPQGTMTRAMFVTVLWRIAGCPAAESESAFTDLTADWYRASVAWGAETGVVKGLSDTEFGPNYPVTREQMCVLLCRFAEYLGLNIGSAGSVAFSDAGDISAWAMDAIGVCAGNGLILGVGDNRFAPKDTAKRMEVSALFTRFITQMVEKYAPAAE